MRRFKKRIKALSQGLGRPPRNPDRATHPQAPAFRCFPSHLIDELHKRPESDVPSGASSPTRLSPLPLPCASPLVPFHLYHGKIAVLRLVSTFSSICVEARTGAVDLRAEQRLEQ